MPGRWLIAALAYASLAAPASAQVPYVFTPGTPAKAAEMSGPAM